MSKKKHVAKAAGASLLAAATIISGLSFGSIAASAAPETNASSSADRISTRLAVYYHAWSGAPAPSGWRGFTPTRFGSTEDGVSGSFAPVSAQQAWNAASPVTAPAFGTSGPIVFEDGRCLSYTDYLRAVTCTGAASQNFTVSATGRLGVNGKQLNNDVNSGSRVSAVASNGAGGSWELTGDGTPIVANGGLTNDDGATTELKRGQDTNVPFGVKFTGSASQIKGKINLTAPAGTTFADGQQMVNGQYTLPGGSDWKDSTSLTLKNGSLSADKKTLSYDIDTQTGNGIKDQRFRWNVKVNPGDAPQGSQSLAYSFQGTTSAGDSKVNGATPVTIPAPAVENGGIVADNGPEVELERSQATPVQFGIKYTAVSKRMQSTITLTAPAGTTFADGQSTLAAEYRHEGQTAWTGASALQLKNGTLSDDKRTLTAQFDATYASRAGTQFRWFADVNPGTAPAGTGSLGYKVVGTTDKGATDVTGSTKTTIPEAAFPAPSDLQVQFDTDVTKKATVSGKATTGASIEILDGTTVVGTGTATNGTFTIPVTATAAGNRTLTVKATLGAESNTATVTANYGTAVTAATPAAATDAKVTLTGTGTDGAKVSFTDATGTKRETTVTGGTWSLQGAFKNGATNVTVSAVSKGALTTTATTTVTVNQARKAITLTSPTQADADAGKIKSGDITFTGTATPFAEIKLELWAGARGFTTTADANGNWTGKVWVGESTYTPIIKQTVLGSTDQITPITFSTVAYQNLTNVRPNANDVIRPSQAVFSGNGTTGASIEVWTGPKDSGWARKIATTTVTNGAWNVRGVLSADTTYTLHTYQSLGTKSDMVVTKIDTGAEIKDLANITATNVGDTTTITATAQPGATVEIWTGPKDSGWAVKRFTGTADQYGHVTMSAYLGAGNAYTLHGYQSWNGTVFGNSTTFSYTPAV
jgi:hypothetical protein